MKKRSFWVRACISIAFLIFLFKIAQKSEFTDRLRQIDPFYFTLSLLMVCVMIPLSCLKWQVLLRQQGKKIGFFFLLRIYLVGYFFSNLLPSNVGGDVVRSYYIGRHIGDQSLAAVSVFIERVSGIIFLLILTIVVPLLKPALYASPYIFIPALASSAILLIIAWMWKTQSILELLNKIAKSVFGAMRKINNIAFLKAINKLELAYVNIFDHLGEFRNKLLIAVKYLRSNPKQLVNVIILTALFYIMTWVNVYVSFLAFGVKHNFMELSALVPTALFVGMIPVPSLANLGFTEGIYVAYFGLAGINTAASLAMGLLLRLKLLIVGISGFFFYLTYRHDARYDIPELANNEKKGN